MQAFGERVMQIPDEAMHAGCVEKRLRVAHPVHGQFNGVRISLIQLVIAGKTAHEFPCRVEDFELNRRAGCFSQIIIEHGAVRGICGERFVHWDWSALIIAGTHAKRGLRNEEKSLARLQLRVELSQWSDVV